MTRGKFKNDIHAISDQMINDLEVRYQSLKNIPKYQFLVPKKEENGMSISKDYFENVSIWNHILRDLYGDQLEKFSLKELLKPYLESIVDNLHSYYPAITILLSEILETGFDEETHKFSLNDELIELTQNYFEKDMDEYKIIVPLSGMEIDEELILNDLNISPLNWRSRVNLTKDIQVMGSSFYSEVDSFKYMNSKTALEFRFQEKRPTSFFSVYDRGQIQVQRVINLLQIFNYSGVRSLGVLYYKKYLKWHLSSTQKERFGFSAAEHETLKISSNSELKNFLSEYMEDDKFENGELKFVFDRLRETWRDKRSSQFMIFDYMSIIEAIIVGEQGELKFRTSVLASNYLGETREKKRQIYDLLSKCYHVRSKVAHCDYKIGKGKDVSPEELKEMGHLAHMLIKRAMCIGIEKVRTGAMDSLF